MGFNRDATVRLRAAAVLTVMFGAGTALGFAIDRDGARAPAEASEASRGVMRERAEPPNEWIIDRLDLAAEQRTRVDSVVAYYGARMGDLQKEYRPQYRAIVDSTDGALRALLNQEQRARYDSLEAAAERWRARNRSSDRNR